MVYVPAGEFWMGSDDSDPAARDNEKPRHKVHVDAFWIDRTQVTNAQYRQCVEAGSCSPPTKVRSLTRENYYGNPEYDDYPVIHVSWHQARDYAEWVGGRLPTEAEWEKAARGTDGRIYPWGNDWDATRCNTTEGGKRDTTPVGAYPQGASPYGALDMAGNVREWTQSLYHEYPYDPDDGREDLDAGGRRVVRGGSFVSPRANARCALRSVGDRGGIWDFFGFRVVSPISP